jgi:glycosyltransferase involved in cell wall biosynthesis
VSSRVLFHDNQIGERGTTQAVLDYARSIRAYGHDVALSYNVHSKGNNADLIQLVEQEFKILGYENDSELLDFGAEFDAVYFQKAGHIDGKSAGPVHTVVHSVFQNFEPHGNFYGYISPWLARHMRRFVYQPRQIFRGLIQTGRAARAAGCENALAFDHISYICEMPAATENLRAELGIPDEAFVILRYGGFDTFDIPFVQELIPQLLTENPNWYFLGVNTEKFVEHPRVIYHPKILNKQVKANMLASANVFLNARLSGESFGLANAEALQLGLPVLAWSGGSDQNHVEMLRNLGGIYKNEKDLSQTLQRISQGFPTVQKSDLLAEGAKYRTGEIAPKLASALKVSAFTVSS